MHCVSQLAARPGPVPTGLTRWAADPGGPDWRPGQRPRCSARPARTVTPPDPEIWRVGRLNIPQLEIYDKQKNYLEATFSIHYRGQQTSQVSSLDVLCSDL